MPRIHPAVSRVLTVAMLVTSVFADTVTLKNGEHLEGKITKETDKDITMEVQVSAGITDERVVAKKDIEKVDKLTPELAAYQQLANVQLGANSLPAPDYDRYVNALQSYLTQYPNSRRASDVQTTLQAFQDEKKRVTGGEIKIDNQWLSKAEAEKESVQIHGRIYLEYMKSQSASGDYVGALNTFAALEKAYPGAAAMPDAIELALQLAQRVKTAAEQAIPVAKELKSERDTGAAAAGTAQKAEILAATKKEDDAADAAVTAATAATRWPPFNRTHEKSLLALQVHATTEITRLAALPVAKMRESLQQTEAAKQSLTSGDVNAASDAIKQANQLWAANELAVRLGKEIEAEKAAKTPVASPGPVAAPTTPKPAPKPNTPRPSAALQATPVGAPAPVAAAEADDDKPFIMTLPGAVSVVVGLAVVLAGANIFLKMKRRKAEEAEQHS